MNRPASVKPDNFFLLIFRALSQKRVPIALRIVAHSLLLVTLALVIYAWVMGMQFRQAMADQADAVGASLTTQTASSATELLVANDILSLNVLLNNLVKNPLVAHAAIYSVDNRILAEAGSRPTQGLLDESDGLFSTPLTFQEVIAGHLRIALDMRQFHQPMMISLQSMGILALILLALTLSLSLRLGRQVSTPLLQLRVWLRDPDDPAPGAARQDEIGDLARQMQARLVPPRAATEAPEDDGAYAEDDLEDDYHEDFDDGPSLGHDEPEEDPDFDEHVYDEQPPRPVIPREQFVPMRPAAKAPAPVAEPALSVDDDFDPFAEEEEELPPPAPPAPQKPLSSAVLAVRLGSQEQLRQLPRARLESLLGRYRDCLAQAARLYRGELQTLADGSSLLLFHERDCKEQFLAHGVCCGELLRALGHELQIDVADSGITLQLQLGLTQGDALQGLGQAELLLSEAALAALALSQHSRNLLLVQRTIGEDAQVRQRARIRPIASPQGAACVERLLDPQPALLERQLARLRNGAQ